MQLVATGAQDGFLTSDPQITYFKVVYRRHTPFACEAIQQTINGTQAFGSRLTVTVSRNGDLIGRIWVKLTVAALTGGQWVRKLGHALLSRVELEIGGSLIDRQYGEWMELWSELTLPEEKRSGYLELIGDTLLSTTLSAGSMWVPLQFYFCRNPGLALPLIALMYHEVKLNIEVAALSAATIYYTSSVPTSSAPSLEVWVDYFFLDSEERKRFAQMKHEYLIDQLQYTGADAISSTTVRSRLNFNHPVSELVFVFGRPDRANLEPFNYGVVPSTGLNTGNILGQRIMQTCKLQLNGHDRFAERDGTYFNLIQPYQSHTRIPTSKGIYMYSFALNPEEHQPSGTLNFSRIDNATLAGTLLTGSSGYELRVYARNYNLLRIASGMGGIAFSS